MIEYCSKNVRILHAGTGKSVTGAHLAFALAMKLKEETSSTTSTSTAQSSMSASIKIAERKPCVMYCGPSNQAVNVVLGKDVTYIMYLNFVKIFLHLQFEVWWSCAGADPGIQEGGSNNKARAGNLRVTTPTLS